MEQTAWVEPTFIYATTHMNNPGYPVLDTYTVEETKFQLPQTNVVFESMECWNRPQKYADIEIMAFKA